MTPITPKSKCKPMDEVIAALRRCDIAQVLATYEPRGSVWDGKTLRNPDVVRGAAVAELEAVAVLLNVALKSSDKSVRKAAGVLMQRLIPQNG